MEKEVRIVLPRVLMKINKFSLKALPSGHGKIECSVHLYSIHCISKSIEDQIRKTEAEEEEKPIKRGSYSAKGPETWRKTPRIESMAIPVVEFSGDGYKIRKFLDQLYVVK